MITKAYPAMDNNPQPAGPKAFERSTDNNYMEGKHVIIRYRLHTEHIAPALVSRYFDGFSILSNVRGFYKGKGETSVIVEILGTADDAGKVRTLAQDIREQYRQQEVWITTEEVTLTRVTIDAIREGF